MAGNNARSMWQFLEFSIAELGHLSERFFEEHISDTALLNVHFRLRVEDPAKLLLKH